MRGIRISKIKAISMIKVILILLISLLFIIPPNGNNTKINADSTPIPTDTTKWAPQIGTFSIIHLDGNSYKLRSTFKWTDVSGFVAPHNRYEHEIIIFNWDLFECTSSSVDMTTLTQLVSSVIGPRRSAGLHNPLTECQAASMTTNLENAYVDTRLFDTKLQGEVFTVGTTSVPQINKDYWVEFTVNAGSPTDSEIEVDGSLGHEAGKYDLAPDPQPADEITFCKYAGLLNISEAARCTFKSSEPIPGTVQAKDAYRNLIPKQIYHKGDQFAQPWNLTSSASPTQSPIDNQAVACSNKSNGKYCGGSLGLSSNTLYKCFNGNVSAIQSCTNGCNLQPQGTDDFCNAGSSTSTCPNSQNGLYCGSSLGLDANTLYNCQNGVTSNPQTCSLGCIQKPPGTADVCRTSTSGGSCPSGGNGNYCGTTLGLDPNTLFNCNAGNISLVQQCSNGCELKPPGTPDACYAVGSGSGGNTGAKLTLYGDSNYGASSIRVQVGTGDTDAPDRGAWYKSMAIPSGWSVILSDQHLGQVGNSQCFSSSVSNLESYGGWANSIESMRVFSTNVCPAPNIDGVRICRVTGSYSDHPNDCSTVTQDIPDLNAYGFGNDTLKSIDIGGDWEVVLFEDWHYGARRYVTNGTNTDLGGIPFGYGTSSIQVRRRQPAVFTLYRLGDYNDGHPFGSDRTLPNLEYWNSGNENINDGSQSMRVASGYEVIGCSNSDFHGVCGRINHDVSDLNALAQGLRNGLSSIQVCVGSCPPTSVPPALISPTDTQSFLPGVPVSLSWAGNGDQYQIEYWGGIYGNSVQSTGWREGMTAWTKTDFAASSEPYYWHVQSWTSMGDSGWSPVSSFKVQDTAPIIVYINGPDNTILSTDQTYTALASPSESSNLTYSWTPTPKSGQGTATATYNFATPSSQSISVAISNTGGSTNTQSNINVGCAPGKYLSEYYNGTSLNGPSLGYACEDNIDHIWGTSGPVLVPSTSFKVGDGRDGSLNVDSGQTVYTDNVRTKISSAAANAQNILCVASTSGFSVGDQVLIIQSQGSGVGSNEFGTISNISGCGFTLQSNLTNSYTASGQVIKVPQYTNVNVSGVLTVHQWDGNTGGVMVFKSMGSVHLNGGSIDASGTGYRGPSRTYGAATTGKQGEGLNGVGGTNRSPNEPGGGGAGPGTGDGGAGAGGGAYRTPGTSAKDPFYGDPGIGSSVTYGTDDLALLYFGGAGGSGGTDDSGWDNNSFGGKGGNGGGIIYIEANSIDGAGNIISAGQTGEDHNNNPDSEHGGGGGGAGGSIKILTDKVNTDNIAIGVEGGAGGRAKDGYAGNGGSGQSYIQYCTKLGASALIGATSQLTTCDKDNFSARWTSNMNVTTAGTYKFTTWTDDGTKVWVDGELLIDRWVAQSGSTPYSGNKSLTVGSHQVKMEYFEAGGDAKAQFSIEQIATNTTPVVNQIPGQTITNGASFSTINLSTYGSDADVGDTLTWSYSGNTNISVSIASNVATLTYPANWTGTENITFTASDTSNASASSTAAFQVNTQVCTVYTATYFNNTSLTGSPVTTVCEADIDHDWGGNAPSGLNVDAFSIRWLGNINFATAGNYKFTTWTDDGTRVWVDGTLLVDRWVPQDGQTPYAGTKTLTAGVHEVKMEYYEGGGGAKAQLYITEVTNTAPTVTQIPGQTVTTGQTFSSINLSSYGSDADAGDSLTWSYSGNTNITVGITGSTATLTFPANWTGAESITFKATDTHAAFATSTAAFQVNATAPTGTELLTSPWHLTGNNGASELYQTISQSVLQGKTTMRITYDLHGLNALAGDASAIIFDQNGWKYISLSNYGINGQNGPQTVDIPLSAFTGLDLSVGSTTVHTRFWYGSTFTVDITSIKLIGSGGGTNNPPTITSTPVITVNENEAYSYDVNATDPEGNTLTYSLTQGRPGMTMNSVTGVISWNPSYSDAGTYSIILAVNDGVNIVPQTYSLTVNDVNRTPVITQIPGQAKTTGETFSTINLSTYGTDPDTGDNITWSYSGNTNVSVSITSNVATLTFNPSWTGVENITFKATDTHAAFATSTATFAVTAAPTCVFTAQYYNNKTLSGTPVLTRCESDISYIWWGDSPAPGVNADNFSVRWVGNINFTAGTYSFVTESDNGIRLWVDTVQKINNWTSHSPVYNKSSVTLTTGTHEIKVEYYEATGDARAVVSWLVPQTQTSTCSTVGKFCAKYFNNTNLTGTPVLSLLEPDIDHDWGTTAPGGGVNADNYSVRWEGQFDFNNGTYEIGTASDDGVRVWVDGVLVIDNWVAHGYEEDYADVPLTAGLHTIKMEFYEAGGNAMAAIWWDQL